MKLSDNVITIPLNPEGALEMGLNPCDYCHVGSMAYNDKGKIYDCIDECNYYKRYKNLALDKKEFRLVNSVGKGG